MGQVKKILCSESTKMCSIEINLGAHSGYISHFTGGIYLVRLMYMKNSTSVSMELSLMGVMVASIYLK